MLERLVALVAAKHLRVVAGQVPAQCVVVDKLLAADVATVLGHAESEHGQRFVLDAVDLHRLAHGDYHIRWGWWWW